MVEEHTADDLAEESDDERRIEKAERAAERKIKIFIVCLRVCSKSTTAW